MGKKKRQHAVRMLDQAVRLHATTVESGMSEVANGRLTSNLRKDVRLLKSLAQDGPDGVFWEALQKTILKLVRYVRWTKC